MGFFDKRLNDERINKENNKILSRGMDLFGYCMVVCMIFKYCKLSYRIQDFCLELIVLLTGGGFILAQFIRNGLISKGNKDSCLKEVKDNYKAMGFGICMSIMVFGQFIYMLLTRKMSVAYLYFIVYLLPAFYVTVQMVRRGTLTAATQKNRKIELGRLLRSSIIGGLIFGVLISGKDVYSNHTFHMNGMPQLLVSVFVYAVSYYFFERIIIAKSDKNAC